MALKSNRRHMGGEIRKEMRNKGFYLNLTSMVDMFCIILVFLLVSYSVTDTALAPPKGMVLPSSISRALPETSVKIAIGLDQITLEDRPVVALNQGKLNAQDVQGLVIFPLYRELKAFASQHQDAKSSGQKVERRLILQGDKSIPFDTLKRVMFTAGQAEYEGFRFTVMRKEAMVQ